MDYELTEEQRKKKDAFERFCVQQIEPSSLLIEKGGKKGQKKLKACYGHLGEVGYLGLRVPEQWGGQGEELMLGVACDEILAKACRSTYLSAYTSAVHCGRLIERYGSTEQKKVVLGGLSAGRRIASIARSEAKAGSDVQGITTEVQKQGGGFLLNGQKDYCVNAPIADDFLVFARSGEVNSPEKGLSVFLVPAGLPGVEIEETVETMGYTGTPICRVAFNQCTLPQDSLLGVEGRGWEIVQESLEWDATGIVSTSVAIIEKTLEASLAYSQERMVFGKPIGSYQEVSFKLAEIKVMLDTARLLSSKAAWLKDIGDLEAKVFLSCAKLYASEAATKCSSYAVQIHGGQGLIKGSLTERLYRDARYGEIGGGTSEIHRLSIAKAVLQAVE